MALHRHPSKSPARPGQTEAQHAIATMERGMLLNPLFARLSVDEAVPVDVIGEHGALPETAAAFVSDQLMLDGNARLNLATFVTTWMEPEAKQLMADTIDKNMIDKDEYPRTAEVEQRCVNMIANLWNSPEGEHVGTSTTGSSEACMLGGLALKWRWRERMTAAGKPTDRPNLVMGSNVQVVWEKFCRYFDVECRIVNVDHDTFHLMPEPAAAACDENTIGVVAVLGSTYDGSYEPVEDIAAALDALEAKTGLDIPIHVDGASGGFIAPFLDPDLNWDFRVDRVVSINASGHKYGLVYPGVGWAIWRTPEHLPEDLIFRVAYLGGDMPTFALNFSRPGAQVVAQYYNFVRLGMDGYRKVQQGSRDVARHLAHRIDELGPFSIITDGSELPVVAFRLNDDVDRYTVYDVSERLRLHGWLVPAYPMPEGAEDMHILRVVVRNGFSLELANLLADDLATETAILEEHGAPIGSPKHPGFAH